MNKLIKIYLLKIFIDLIFRCNIPINCKEKKNIRNLTCFQLVFLYRLHPKFLIGLDAK